MIQKCFFSVLVVLESGSYRMREPETSNENPSSYSYTENQIHLANILKTGNGSRIDYGQALMNSRLNSGNIMNKWKQSQIKLT
jgi:hypothetical protein